MLSITELTTEQEEVVNRSLRGGPADQVLVEGFRLQISRRDIATLSGLNWLNDEVSNADLLFDLCFHISPVGLFLCCFSSGQLKKIFIHGALKYSH